MLNSLNTGVSGLEQSQQRIEVIGNNIANVGTTGFKSARTDFADTFSQTLRSSGSDIMQVGTGVTTSTIHNQFGQGTLTNTGKNTDLAINGDGFFIFRNTADSSQYVTRAGNFTRDANGYLITDNQMRVQGFSDSGLSARGDLLIDGAGTPGDPTATVQRFSIGGDGKITVTMSDGATFVRGQVLLQRFKDPQALVKEGGNLFSGMSAAGALAQPATPNANGLGEIRAGTLEMSNVDLTAEFASLITAQRAFQANSRMITTSDEILQEVVNLKR
jgi:flagellar hook protein FlgE